MESFITGAFSALIIGGFVALFAKPKSKTALYVQNVILVILSVLCFSMLIFSLTEVGEAPYLWAMVILFLLGGFFLGRKLYKNIRLLKSGELEAPQDVAASDERSGLPPENAMDFVDGTYYYRVSEIERREGAVAYFSAFEIVTFTVNLPTAENVLPEKDYKLVSILYDHYRSLKEKKLLSFPDFLKLQNEMIAHFDLIAPYYLFGASDQVKDAEATESKKHEYRERAKKILANGYLFGPDWMRLHREFYDAFYAPKPGKPSEDFPIKPE